MENSETLKPVQEFKYQILEENGKSRVIFEDKTYLLNTLRAKRFAIVKTKKLIRLTKKMEQMMQVKTEENADNPFFSADGLLQSQINDYQKKYKYESRHNHATNRKRDDKGRFISRQLRQQQLNDEELLKGTMTSPIIVPEDPQEQHICYLLAANGFINQYDLMQQKCYQNNENDIVPDTPWLERRAPATPAIINRKESMNPLQLITPAQHFTEDHQNMNFVGMFQLSGEPNNAKIEQDSDDNNNNNNNERQEMGNQLLLIDFLQQKTKKEESDDGSSVSNGNYFDYLNVGQVKLKSEVMHAN